jgi:hypothetical protein
MNKRAHVFAAILWLLSVVTVYGQVGFTMPTFTNTSTGQNLDVPVTVVNFDTVFAIQYVIKWNPQVLEFTGLTKPNNPLSIVDSLCFNLAEAPQGIIRFRWFNTSSPKTLADGADIFHLQMKVIGVDGTSTPISFTELPPITYYEVVRGPGNQFFNLSNSLITNGLVVVGTVSVNGPSDAEWMALKAAPNPFSDQVSIAFDVAESGPVQYYITDVAGKICYSEKKYLNSGRNGTVIANGVFPAKGLYFVHVLSGGRHAVQPIVYQ